MTSTLERLTDGRAAQARLKAEERRLVAQARAEKHSWATIGRALGITKQACQRMFTERRPDIENLPLSDPLFDPLFTHKD